MVTIPVLVLICTLKRQFGEGSLSFETIIFGLNSVINFEALFNNSRKLMYFFYSLSISLFLLLHDFQWSMFLAEYSVTSLSFYTIDFHKVVGSPSALNVKRYHTLTMLALNTSTFVLQSADYALQVEPFVVNLVQANWRLGGNDGTWNPHSTA